MNTQRIIIVMLLASVPSILSGDTRGSLERWNLNGYDVYFQSYHPHSWRNKRASEGQIHRQVRDAPDLRYPAVSWQYQTPASTVPLVNPSPFFNWFYLKPHQTLVQPQLPVVLNPDYSVVPAIHQPGTNVLTSHAVIHPPLNGRVPVNPYGQQQPPAESPMHTVVQHHHIKHVSQDEQTRRDEQLVNSLYSTRRPQIPQQNSGLNYFDESNLNNDEVKRLYKKPPPPLFTYTSSTEVPIGYGFRPSVSPFSAPPSTYSSTTGLPNTSPYVQRIANNRRGKQYSTNAPTTHRPNHYHAPEAHLSSFGHVIIHDKNE